MDRLASKRIMVAACVLMTGLCAAGQDHTIRPVPFRVVYADDDATGENDGTSWADAFVYLQDALAVAGRGDRVRVAQGLYKPDQGVGFSPGDRDARFLLVNGVTLAGGYAGLTGTDPNERDIDRYETILSGDLDGDDGPDFSNMDDNSRIVVASLSSDATTILDGFTITGGWGYSGSGVTCLASDLRMERCTVVHNKTMSSTGNGAGMYSSGGSPVLKACVFRNNFTWDSGGGLWGKDGDLTFVDCLFEGNKAEHDGGGVCFRNGVLKLERCTFRGNEAFDGGGMHAEPSDGSTCIESFFIENTANRNNPFEGSGGGVLIGGAGSSMAFHRCLFERNYAPEGGGLNHTSGVLNRNVLALTRCLFRDNNAGQGGALSTRLSSLRATDCLFESNVASGDGGGAVHVRDGIGRGDPEPTGPGPVFTRCRFAGNRAYSSPGGGLYNDNSYTTLMNCLFVGNASFDGGAVYSRGASPTLMHCTLAQNRGGSIGGLSDEAGGAVLDHCIVWDNDDDELSGAVVIHSNVDGGWPGEGNIDVDPCFASVGHWRSDSISRAATWVDGDYHLKSQAGRWDPTSESWVRDDVTSPCIDAGDPLVPVGDEPLPNGGIINIGAYGGTTEASKTYLGGVVFYVDDDANEAGDGLSWATALTRLQDALAAAWPGDEIRMAQGIYIPTDDPLDREASFELKAGTTIRGGYAGLMAAEPNAWDPNAFVTVLSGDIDRNDVSEDATSKERNRLNVVRCEGLDSQAVLEGVVVTAGCANAPRSHSRLQAQGGGLFCQGGCSPRLTDCVFTDNYAGSGGAVCLFHTDGSGSDEPYEGDQWQPVFTRCTFLGNRASWGGAVSNGRRWRPVFAGCLWEDNVAEYDGGAIGSHIKADLTLRHCVFRRNDAGAKGGALSAHSVGRIELVNCLLVANTAADGGGAIAYPEGNYVNEPQVHRLVNCTFYGNASPTLDRPPTLAVMAKPEDSWVHLPAMTIANCIVYGSVADPISGVPASFLPGPVLPEIITSICEPGPDPLFVDPFGADGVLGTEDDDFRLASDSPAIDSGSNQTEPPLPAFDLAGNWRVTNSIVDMGAYEFAGEIAPPGTGR